ncbi:TPA: hypothetical protein ACGO62_001122 [Streptococcus suis]
MANLTPELIAMNERIKAFNAKRQAQKARPKIEVKVEFEADAKGVKQFLKLHGYNPKDFKVRKANPGYERSLYITIKNVTISKKEIENLVYPQFQKISRCEITQEILSGGNTYVFVEYDEDTFEELVESKTQEAEQLYNELKNLPDWDGLHIEKNGCDLYLSNHKGSFPTYTVRNVEANFHHCSMIYSPRNIAWALAEIEAH